MRLLLVEDDPDIASGVAASLRRHGGVVDTVHRLDDAWGALRVEPYDAMLLDLGLPDGDGLTLLRRLRQTRAPAHPLPPADLPVIIMTARDAVPDRISGLDTGADDYLVKPFDVNELMARLRAAVRRAAGRASPLLVHGTLVLDPAARTVTRDGQPVALSHREYGLLLTLLQHRGHVLERSRLEAALYGFDQGLESNAIEVHVHHLRRKLGEGVIRTVRGVGYFVPRPPEDSAA